ncbi:MAG: LpxI family protein [Sulfitobacter sp.]
MLALIAGRGDLPGAVMGGLERAPLVCALEDTPPQSVRADLTFRLETLGSFLIELGNRGVTEVCFAGAIDRPALDPSKIDAETAPLVPMFLEALQKGDDGALRVVLELFEKTGFTLRGAHEIAPDLLVKPGVLGDKWPDAQMREDAGIGAAHITALGPKDIGQSCIVAAGRVIGMEDASGTDALIGRCADQAQGGAAILFKGPKPQQSRLIDLPTIGPETLRRAGQAGLAGIVLDADDVLVLDQTRCAALADELGLVLWARSGT